MLVIIVLLSFLRTLFLRVFHTSYYYSEHGLKFLCLLMPSASQVQDVDDFIYDTCGLYWPRIHHFTFVVIILMQITMIGLFGLKSKPATSISTIPLLLITILFNEYFKIRFLPAVGSNSLQASP